MTNFFLALGWLIGASGMIWVALKSDDLVERVMSWVLGVLCVFMGLVFGAAALGVIA